MREVRVGIRWWLGAIFALIAILTAALTAVVTSRQTESDLRANAKSIAVGAAVSAAFAVERARAQGTLRDDLVSIGGQHGLALFVFSASGTPIATSDLGRYTWQQVPERRRALTAALHDHRFVESFDDGRATVVALPLHRPAFVGALVAYAPRPPAYRAAKTILRNDVLRAAIWAILAAALTGLLAASLIARRLQRIASAAAAIEQGDFDLELTPRFRDEIGTLGVTIDRMRRRLGGAFARLSADRDRLGRLLEQLREGVIAVDRELRVDFANSNARAFLGGDLAHGTKLPESYAGLPLRQMAEALFAPGASVSEARSETAEGVILSVVGLPASSSDLVVLVLADVTEAERRRRAEREFVTNASHELRTPVTAITSAVEALRAGAGDDADTREHFVELIGRQAKRLTRLTNSLLTLARAQTRQEPLELESVTLAPLLAEVAAASPHSGDVAVRVDCEPWLAATGRADIIEQVVANLVGNALKHTTAGEIVLRGRERDGEVLVEVADTGTGIPARAQRRVFERFYSDDGDGRSGFGLGLAIARDATEAIGGRLTIESREGRGTTACVVLRAGHGSSR